MYIGDQRWTHVCWGSMVAMHKCEDQQWCHMYVCNQLWLHMYVWGSMVATNVCWGSMVAVHVSSSMVVANINYDKSFSIGISLKDTFVESVVPSYLIRIKTKDHLF